MAHDKSKPWYLDYEVYLALVAALAVLLLLRYSGYFTGQAVPVINGWFLLQFLIVFPLLEEIIFRGWFLDSLLRYPALAHRFMGISLANVVVSLLFAALHGIVQQNILILGGIFLSSVVFGYFYQKYLRVSVSVFLHIHYNLFLLLFMGVPGLFP